MKWLFEGKTRDGGKTVKGSYVHMEIADRRNFMNFSSMGKVDQIVEPDGTCHTVDPETVHLVQQAKDTDACPNCGWPLKGGK